MTRTQERLSDALHAAAQTVRPGTLRPLTTHDPERPRGPNRRRRRHLSWRAPASLLAPAAAAVGVAVVIAGTALVAGTVGVGSKSSAPGVSPPRFYAVVVVNEARGSPYSFQLRDTRTGRRLATFAMPMAAGWSAVPVVSVAADRSTFFLAASRGLSCHGTGQSRFYRAKVSRSGHITEFGAVGKPVVGSVDPMAVSPDGSRIAYAVAGCSESHGRRQLDRLVVQDLGTGASRVWTGTKSIVNILRLTWTVDGRTLGVEYGQPDGTGLVAVRAVDVTKPGASLQDSRLVYSQRRCCGTAAVLSPGGSSVVVATTRSLGTRGYLQQVRQIPLAGGPSRLFFESQRSAVGMDALLFSDSSGRHWILIAGNKFGWLSGGRLVPLAPSPLAPNCSVTPIVPPTARPLSRPAGVRAVQQPRAGSAGATTHSCATLVGAGPIAAAW